MGRFGAAGPLLLAAVMLSDCRAGRVFFPGPSIGPAPPSLWQSLHTLRQARRLDGTDDGAPELRAAGVRIGQKYSDLEELPLLDTELQQQPLGLQPLRDGGLEPLQPLEPLDIPETLEVRGQLDVQQNDDALPLRVNEVEHQQNSENLQTLTPLPFLLAAEPRGAELRGDVLAVTSDPRGFKSLNGDDKDQHPGEFVSFDDSLSGSEITSDGFSRPDPGDIITLDEASDLSQPALVTGQIPEGVAYTAPPLEDVNFSLGPAGEHISGEQSLPRQQDLQSAASVIDSAPVERPETHPPFRRPEPRAWPAATVVAEGPLRPDQNLLNVLVTQGVLRPVGRVRVARLRLVTDDEHQEEEGKTKLGVFFAPAHSDDRRATVEPDKDTSEGVSDEKRIYREEPGEKTLLELTARGEDEAEIEDGEGWPTLTATSDEQQRVLDSNVVPILSEREIFDRLVTPRASSFSTIAGTAPAGVPAADGEPAAIELSTESFDDPRRQETIPKTGSLAARLTELGSRISHHGAWGRRLSSATLRVPTDNAGIGRRGNGQEVRDGGWQSRKDVEEPVFVDVDGDDLAGDLDTEGSERHEVEALDEEGDVLREEMVPSNAESERTAEVPRLDESGIQHQDVATKWDEKDTARWKAASAETTESTRTDIVTERTINFRTSNSTEDEDEGPPQLVAEMFNCPEIGGNITLECRIKNAPEHDKIKRFWWLRRHFDGDDNAVRDELLAANGVGVHADNISVQQVAAARQRLTVTAVAAADTGLYMCQAGWADTLQEVEMLVFLCH